MPLNNPAFRAGGTINASRFVVIDGSTATGTDFVITQAVAASAPIGISQDGSKRVPGVNSLTAADALIAAEAGDAIQVYGVGDVCNLQVGTAADLTAGTFLAPDANGAAIAAASTKYIGAVALEAASKSVSGGVTNLVRVQVMAPQLKA